jgi:type II secretory pathway pseudopilin PulG
MRRFRNRGGISLLELLVVVGIVATLAGLLLGAVQRVRAEANRVKSLNRLRQIALATQNYCAAHHGRYPVGPWLNLLDYLEADKALTYPLGRYIADHMIEYRNRPYVVAYQSPADPTLPTPADLPWPGDASYASNHRAFLQDGSRWRPASLGACRDGASLTIAYGEHYAQCHRTGFAWVNGGPITCFDSSDPPQVVKCVGEQDRGANFANADFDDVMPVTVNGVTLPSVPGVTFQVRPSKEACDYRQLQTPHPGGMLTAYLDGSVRTTSPRVSPAVFWAAVTPAGGEVAPPE